MEKKMQTAFKALMWIPYVAMLTLVANEVDTKSEMGQSGETVQQGQQLQTEQTEYSRPYMEVKKEKPSVSELQENNAYLGSSLPFPDRYGIHLEGGLLYEMMIPGHTEIAVIHGSESSNRLNTNWMTPFRYDNSQQISFDLDIGAKGALAIDFENGWRLLGGVDWLSSTGKYTNPTLNSTQTLDPIGNISLYYFVDSDPANDIAVGAHTLTSQMQIDYYLLDVSLSRGSFVAKRFSFEPLGGVKGLWVNYNQSELFGDFDTDGVPDNAYWVRTYLASFWGVGPMAGVKCNFYLWNAFSIFANSDISLLFGESRVVSYIGFLNDPTFKSIPGASRYRATVVEVSPTMRVTIGLQYDSGLAKKGANLRIRAGFDVVEYFDQTPVVNRAADVIENAANRSLASISSELKASDLSLMGLIFDVAIDF